MHRALIILILLLAWPLLWACDSFRDARTLESPAREAGWVFEGWSCAPDLQQAAQGRSPLDYCTEADPQEHLYLKFVAAAPVLLMRDTKSPAVRRTACLQEARHALIPGQRHRILLQYLPTCCSATDCNYEGLESKINKLMREAQLYRCCSLDEETGRCEKRSGSNSWHECQCVASFYVRGGQKGLESSLK